MRNNKNMYRKEFDKVVSIVKDKDKVYYINYLCDMMEFDKEEKKEFKKSYKFELLREIEYKYFIEFVKDKNKILMKL